MMNLERAQELKHSQLWGQVVEELDKKIYHLGQKLYNCKSDELINIQMEIKVYQSVKQLPEHIIEREQVPKATLP